MSAMCGLTANYFLPTNLRNASQCIGCGTAVPRRMFRQSGRERPLAAINSGTVRFRMFGQISTVTAAGWA